MNTENMFASFGKRSANALVRQSPKLAVAYTRVSSKEQADKNLSLETQKKSIEEYAARNGISIESYFGGTHESAKTDGRKEFQRMLKHVEKGKGNLGYILVYTLDRFSRTGGGAIKLAQDLREKFGVSVLAVTQPTDTGNPSGILHQDIQFIFSHYDNQLRKQKSVAGMREKLNRGEWVVRVPRGFDIVRTNGQKKILINTEGRLIKQAFEWKASGMKNEEIIQKLKNRSLSISRQQLTKIFANPFYCGKMAHAMLDGKVIDGNQEKMVSEHLFLTVNQVRISASGYGVPHKKQDENLPLKVFIKCGDCGAPFAGYIVKKKGLYYYKCRTTGCRCNRSAKQLDGKFRSLLQGYNLMPCLTPVLEKQLLHIYNQSLAPKKEQSKSLQMRSEELRKNISSLEEKFYIREEMPREIFERLHNKCAAELSEVQKEINECHENISNPQLAIKNAVSLSSNLAAAWASGDIATKEKLQNLVFPGGIAYDRQTDGFRTIKVNSIFELVSSLSRVLGENKKGAKASYAGLSLSAEGEGFNLSLIIYSLTMY